MISTPGFYFYFFGFSLDDDKIVWTMNNMNTSQLNKFYSILLNSIPLNAPSSLRKLRKNTCFFLLFNYDYNYNYDFLVSCFLNEVTLEIKKNSCSVLLQGFLSALTLTSTSTSTSSLGRLLMDMGMGVERSNFIDLAEQAGR